MSRKPEPPKKPQRTKRREVRSRLGNFLMFLPNMIKLLGRLLRDTRVPTAEKALFLGAIVYFVTPVDLIPDIFPFIGQVDDMYLIALTLLRLVSKTDERIVREHWSGGGDIVGLASSIAGLAPMLLPKRVSRVLSSRVELTPAGRVLRGITSGSEPLVREIRAPEKKIVAESRAPAS